MTAWPLLLSAGACLKYQNMGALSPWETGTEISLNRLVLLFGSLTLLILTKVASSRRIHAQSAVINNTLWLEGGIEMFENGTTRAKTHFRSGT